VSVRASGLAARPHSGAMTLSDEHLTIGDWVYQFGYQTTAFVKAAATPCASDDE